MSKKPSVKDITSLANSNKGMLRSASGPALKGKLVRGNNFDGQKLINFTRSKVSQLEQKLEMSKLDLRQKEISLQMVKSLIMEHVN